MTGGLRSDQRIPEAVTFDLSGTLLFDPDKEADKSRRREFMRWILHFYGDRLDKKQVRAAQETVEALSYEWRATGMDDVAGRAIDHVLGALEIRPTEAERAHLRRLLDHLNHERQFLAAEGARDALRALRERSVRLGIVSNCRRARGGERMRGHLERTGLAEYFDPAAIAFSDEVGVHKPDPEIFLVALRALGASPEHAAHVGNNRWRDIAGALRLGMMTVRHAGIIEGGEDGPEADVVIHHCVELAEAIGFGGALARPRTGL